MSDLAAKHGEAMLSLRYALSLFEKLNPVVTESENRAEFNDNERRRLEVENTGLKAQLSVLEAEKLSLERTAKRFREECDSTNAQVKDLEDQVMKLNQRLDSFGAQESWTASLKKFIANNGCPFCMSNMHAHDSECMIYKLGKALGEQSYKAHLAELRAEELEVAQKKQARFGVHLRHCNFGEYSGSCKYGDADCPMLTEDWNWIGRAIDRPEKDRRIVSKMKHLIEMLNERTKEIK